MGKRGEVGKRRREQVVEAAVAIIAEEGLQHLSLSAIEERAGMSRGQLTYYFPAKEDILLAVFDHMIATMHSRAGANEDPPGCHAGGLQGWEHVKAFLSFMILQPPDVPEFHALQYTFLSQVGHRDDFRQRLAQLYGLWRSHMAGELAPELPPGAPHVSASTVSTLVQAVLHGLSMQRAADPAAYDADEMLALVLHLLGGYLGKARPSPPESNHAKQRPRKARPQ